MKEPVFNRLVSIERRQTVQEAVYGTQQVTWVPLAYLPGSPQVGEKFRAEVQDEMPSRSERIQSGMQVTSLRSRVRLRWRDDVDATMRVVIHGETDSYWQIIGGPAEIGGRRKRYIELLVEKLSTSGTAP